MSNTELFTIIMYFCTRTHNDVGLMKNKGLVVTGDLEVFIKIIAPRLQDYGFNITFEGRTIHPVDRYKNLDEKEALEKRIERAKLDTECFVNELIRETKSSGSVKNFVKNVDLLKGHIDWALARFDLLVSRLCEGCEDTVEAYNRDLWDSIDKIMSDFMKSYVEVDTSIKCKELLFSVGRNTCDENAFI